MKGYLPFRNQSSAKFLSEVYKNFQSTINSILSGECKNMANSEIQRNVTTIPITNVRYSVSEFSRNIFGKWNSCAQQVLEAACHTNTEGEKINERMSENMATARRFYSSFSACLRCGPMISGPIWRRPKFRAT